MGWIEESETINEDMLGISYFHTTQGMINDTTSNDTDVLGVIHNETCFYYGSRREIDDTIRWYVDVATGQVFWFMDTRTKIDKAGVTYKDILRLYALPVDNAPSIAVPQWCEAPLCEAVAIGGDEGCRGIGEEVKVVLAVSVELDAEKFGSL